MSASPGPAGKRSSEHGPAKKVTSLDMLPAADPPAGILGKHFLQLEERAHSLPRNITKIGFCAKTL
jgi:hypothetical protein